MTPETPERVYFSHLLVISFRTEKRRRESSQKPKKKTVIGVFTVYSAFPLNVAYIIKLVPKLAQ